MSAVSGRRRTILGLAAGVAVCAAVALVVLLPDDPRDETVTGDEAATAFVEAWAASKWGTYHVESTFRREMADGSELVDGVVLSQDPPDFVRLQFGGVDARIDDKPVLCPADPDGEGTMLCTKGETETTYEELVEAELGRWDNYFFEGDLPLYSVHTSGDGCFDLSLTIVYPEPPYGNAARFCFDEATGAMVFARVERDEGTDTTEAVEIRAQVRAADLALPGLRE